LEDTQFSKMRLSFFALAASCLAGTQEKLMRKTQPDDASFLEVGADGEASKDDGEAAALDDPVAVAAAGAGGQEEPCVDDEGNEVPDEECESAISLAETTLDVGGITQGTTIGELFRAVNKKGSGIWRDISKLRAEGCWIDQTKRELTNAGVFLTAAMALPPGTTMTGTQAAAIAKGAAMVVGNPGNTRTCAPTAFPYKCDRPAKDCRGSHYDDTVARRTISTMLYRIKNGMVGDDKRGKRTVQICEAGLTDIMPPMMIPLGPGINASCVGIIKQMQDFIKYDGDDWHSKMSGALRMGINKILGSAIKADKQLEAMTQKGSGAICKMKYGKANTRGWPDMNSLFGIPCK